jgi:hypothetical protein
MHIHGVTNIPSPVIDVGFVIYESPAAGRSDNSRLVSTLKEVENCQH